MHIESDLPTFGNRLRQARLARNWSMTDLAAKSGVTRQNISLLERDPNRRPKDNTMNALAAALEVDRAWLFYVARSGGRSARRTRKAGQAQP